MPIGLQLVTSLVLALLAVYLITPMAIRVATHIGFYDRPGGYKGHLSPTPYLGGAAVVAGFAAVVALLTADWQRTAPLLAGMALLWAVGTLDDRRTVIPVLRVVAEVAVAAALWALGLGWSLGHGDALDLVVTALWLVAVINAFNFFDNMDGAASSMASVVAAGLAGLGLVQGDPWLCVAGAALCGACLGFLPHNLLASPARIFLGDGGSMPIGFAIGALTMLGTADAAPEWQSLAIGVMLVGVPALDTALVIVSRLRRRIPILTGGRDHMTHRTLHRVQTARAVALVLGGAQALVSALALFAIGAGTTAIPIAAALYVSFACVAVVVFDTRLREPPPARSSPAGAPAWAVRARQLPGRMLILAAIAVATGISPFFFAYYGAGYWAPGGMVLLALAAALVVAYPVRLGTARTLALVGLGGIAALSLISSSWSPSVEQAMIAGNRYAALAALLAVLLVLVRSWRDARWMLAVVTVTGCGTAVVVLAQLAGGDETLFLGPRLNSPLGYINGQAAFFLLLVWPCLAAMEQRRSALLSGAGAFGATVLPGLAVLSQSRGAILALIVSIVVVVAAVPGRLRRIGLLALVGACLAPVVPLLVDVYETRAGGADGVAEIRRAAVALLVAGGVAAVVTAIACRVLRPALAARLRPVFAGGLAIAGCVCAVLAFASRDGLADRVAEQADAFRAVGATSTVVASPRTRLTSGAGNRYDYWRIAWHVWREHPLAGIGAGGYSVPYFRERATQEDVRQPHSLVLQTLSELGVIGGALLAVFLLGAGWGAWRTTRAAAGSAAARSLAVVGIGTTVAWLTQTSVDWLHLLPGVTAVALMGVAVLFVVPARPARAVARRPLARLLPAAVVSLALVAAGVSLSRQVLADRFRADGQAALAKDPATALRDADRSLQILPEGIGGYRLKAAAFARFDQPAAARASLAEALRREPGDFVTWALLGDLEMRVGDLDRAERAYQRAVALNPRDRELRALLREARR